MFVKFKEFEELSGLEVPDTLIDEISDWKNRIEKYKKYLDGSYFEDDIEKITEANNNYQIILDEINYFINKGCTPIKNDIWE